MSEIDKINIGGEVYPLSIAPDGKLDSGSDGFLSKDVDDTGVSATSTYEEVDKISEKEPHKSLFSKFTQMIKNVRILNKILDSLKTTVNKIDVRKATKTTLGQVKIGSGISIDDGKISVDAPTAAFKTAIIDMLYPKGSIYISTNSSLPSGFDTSKWTKLSDNAVLAIIGDGTDNWYGKSIGTHDGTKTITIQPKHLPNHKHTITDNGHSHAYIRNNQNVSTTGNSNKHSHKYTAVKYDSNVTDDHYAVGVHGGTLCLSKSNSTTDTTEAPAHNHDLPSIKRATSGITMNSSGGYDSPDAISVIPRTYNVHAWKRTS